MRITKSTVDAAEPNAIDSYIWDEDLTGFALKVTPAGRKVYLVQYRTGGKTRRYTIGKHGIWTPENARAEAKRVLGEVAAGRDPMEDRDRVRQDQLMTEVLDKFDAEHIKAKLKPRTAEEYQRTIRLHIQPHFKHRRVSEVSRADVARLHSSLADRPTQANRTVAILSVFFNWTEKTGLRPDASNPCRHVEKFRENKRNRFLSGDELMRIGEALRNAEEQNLASPWMVAAIRLLLLTGARLSEILTLKWEYVNFESNVLQLPDSKTGAKTIHLSAPALKVLNDIPRMDGNPFVICGENAGAHLVNLQKPWRRIRTIVGLDDVRLHDLRHSFASVGAASGMSLPMIGALLGHSQPQTTARYAHLSADPLKAATEAIGSKIAAQLDRASERANVTVENVIPLKQ